MKVILNIIRWTFRIIIGLILFWVLTATCLVSFVIPRDEIESNIHKEISKLVKIKNGYSNAELAFFRTFPNLGLVLDDFYILDTTTVPSDTIFKFDELTISLDIPSLLQKRLSFGKINLVKPYIHYVVDSSGTVNFKKVFTINTDKQDTIQTPIIYLNNLDIDNLSAKYDNYLANSFTEVNDINLIFTGRIDIPDSTLDIRHAEVSYHDNNLQIEGYCNSNETDVDITYESLNFPILVQTISNYIKSDEIKNSVVNGTFKGNMHLNGNMRDSSNLRLIVEGNSIAKDIEILSTTEKVLIKNGDYNISYHYDIKNQDSLNVKINSLNLEGDNVNLDANGELTYKNNDYYISASINAKGDLTELVKRTSLPKRGITANGSFDCYLNINDPLDRLMHGYSLPKNLNSLSTKLKLPNIYGHIDLHDFKFLNKENNIASDKIELFFDGTNGFIAKSNIEDIKIKTKNIFATLQDSKIEIDSRKPITGVKINKVGCILKKEQDTTSIQAHTIDLNLSSKRNKFASGNIEELTICKNDNNIFGARVFFDLLKKNLNNKESLWDAVETKMFIATINNKKLSSYGKHIKANMDYNNQISNLKATSDSISLKLSGNELTANKLSLISNDVKSFNINVSSITSSKLNYGIPLNAKSISAKYGDSNIALSIGRLIFGSTDINIDGNISLADKNKTKTRIDVRGEYLNLNEYLIAQNNNALAMGLPGAVPLDSIPKGGVPRGIGDEKNDIILNLNLKKLNVSSLTLDNVTGSVIVKGKDVLLNNIVSKGINNSITLCSLIIPDDLEHATSTISLVGNNLTIKRLRELMPNIMDASPMLSALEGYVDLNIDIKNRMGKIITLDLPKVKLAATLQAKDLSIKDNEEFEKIAKTLMFKNKTSTYIDSLAVAAEMDNGTLTILPFMLKVDRYKIAAAGSNSIITKEIDYHVTILKSPVPFKFGLNIIGSKPYKIKLVKSQYKKLDPSIKPWNDINFINYRESISYPISSFRMKYKI